mmetsp:Transcript_60764/g.177528  ORF Transcript_60764/g.177528 Transcript_60764/m.177528 type:complete len:218 (-) Transcript_60764:399-1052(-)
MRGLRDVDDANGGGKVHLWLIRWEPVQDGAEATADLVEEGPLSILWVCARERQRRHLGCRAKRPPGCGVERLEASLQGPRLLRQHRVLDWIHNLSAPPPGRHEVEKQLQEYCPKGEDFAALCDFARLDVGRASVPRSAAGMLAEQVLVCAGLCHTAEAKVSHLRHASAKEDVCGLHIAMERTGLSVVKMGKACCSVAGGGESIAPREWLAAWFLALH